ncbi:hypothetical protein ILP97_04970 [Amycolatopsis sp. H6(2020)]|nr:hypothetical protein [Amycolatopsis sp. H6(2020)]
MFTSRVRSGAYATRLLYMGAMIGFFSCTTQYLQAALVTTVPSRAAGAPCACQRSSARLIGTRNARQPPAADVVGNSWFAWACPVDASVN